MDEQSYEKGQRAYLGGNRTAVFNVEWGAYLGIFRRAYLGMIVRQIASNII